MNLDRKLQHYDTVACSGKKPRWKVKESTKLCRLLGLFRLRGAVLGKSRDVEIRMLSVCIIWEEKRKEV
jgi:hypothetical protein